MRTLSDLIDKKLKKDKLENERAEAEIEVRTQEVEKRINNQFEKAKYVVGKRLIMRKQHESMYYFTFDTKIGDYRTLYIHSKNNWDTINVDSKFDVTLMDLLYSYTVEESKAIIKTIYIKDLNRTLIDWCKILTDKIIK